MSKKKDRQPKHGGEAEHAGPRYAYFGDTHSDRVDEAWTMGNLSAWAFVDRLMTVATQSAGRSPNGWYVGYSAEQIVKLSYYEPNPEFMRRWVDMLMYRLNESIWTTAYEVAREQSESDKMAGQMADKAIRDFMTAAKALHLELALVGNHGSQLVFERG